MLPSTRFPKEPPCFADGQVLLSAASLAKSSPASSPAFTLSNSASLSIRICFASQLRPSGFSAACLSSKNLENTKGNANAKIRAKTVVPVTLYPATSAGGSSRKLLLVVSDGIFAGGCQKPSGCFLFHS